MGRPDAYDEAIAFLLAEDDFDGAVSLAWDEPLHELGGILFDHTGWDGSSSWSIDCGCLTQVKAGFKEFGGPKDMLPRLLADERVPDSPTDVTRASLPAFAEWQRELDIRLGRPAPVWDENCAYVRGVSHGE